MAGATYMQKIPGNPWTMYPNSAARMTPVSVPIGGGTGAPSAPASGGNIPYQDYWQNWHAQQNQKDAESHVLNDAFESHYNSMTPQDRSQFTPTTAVNPTISATVAGHPNMFPVGAPVPQSPFQSSIGGGIANTYGTPAPKAPLQNYMNVPSSPHTFTMQGDQNIEGRTKQAARDDFMRRYREGDPGLYGAGVPTAQSTQEGPTSTGSPLGGNAEVMGPYAALKGLMAPTVAQAPTAVPAGRTTVRTIDPVTKATTTTVTGSPTPVTPKAAPVAKPGLTQQEIDAKTAADIAAKNRSGQPKSAGWNKTPEYQEAANLWNKQHAAWAEAKRAAFSVGQGDKFKEPEPVHPSLLPQYNPTIPKDGAGKYMEGLQSQQATAKRAYSHTATGPNGEKIGWNGTAWEPVQ